MSAAVPRYVGNEFGDAPPGHKFRLYLTCYDQDWEIDKEEKRVALADAASVPEQAERLLEKIVKRQVEAASSIDAARLTAFAAVSESPLVTGTGMEHPLENGFAFLDPYGLPYLPASSIKGVVRRAAEELALFDNASGWTIADVWWLFGFDAESAYIRPHGAKKSEEDAKQWRDRYVEAVKRCPLNGLERLLEAADAILREAIGPNWRQNMREALALLCSTQGRRAARALHNEGALCFWDSFPKQLAKGLRVDVLNPHFGDYYGSGRMPSDDGDPKPNYFLTIPAGTPFAFFVQYASSTLVPGSVAERWPNLLRAAIEHACAEVGLGAKGGVGYGRMRLDPNRSNALAADVTKGREARQALLLKAEQGAKEAARREAIAAMSPVQQLVVNIEDAAVADPPNEEFLAQSCNKLLTYAGEDQKSIASALKAAYERLRKWSGKQSGKQDKKNSQIKAILGGTG